MDQTGSALRLGSEDLRQAIEDGDASRVRDLMEIGVDPNQTFGQSYPPLVLAADRSNAEIAEVLILHGARIDSATPYGITPLHAAAAAGSVSVIEILLDAGVYVDISTEEGFTPLMLAASWGHLDAVRDLVKRGADVNHRARYGDTALICAQEKRKDEVVMFLRSVGASELSHP